MRMREDAFAVSGFVDGAHDTKQPWRYRREELAEMAREALRASYTCGATSS
jgi:hypothetical protein